jgi:hypothetical protein
MVIGVVLLGAALCVHAEQQFEPARRASILSLLAEGEADEATIIRKLFPDDDRGVMERLVTIRILGTMKNAGLLKIVPHSIVEADNTSRSYTYQLTEKGIAESQVLLGTSPAAV